VRVLAVLLISLSLSGGRMAPPLRSPVETSPTAAASHRGQWYLAATGHAVYCYGPVRFVQQPNGELRRAATFCRGDQVMVLLKD